MWLRKDDIVKVICGEHAGTVGKVLRVMEEEDRVVVEGVNRAMKHVKPSQRNPRGGRVSKEMPIHVSNVALYDTERGTIVKPGVRVNPSGEKVLICKKSGRVLRVLRAPKQTGPSDGSS